MAESHREEIAKLEALYASNPGGRVFVHLAEAYRKAGELDRARSIVTEGLARHADSASGYVVLGRVLADQQNRSESEIAFRRVLELDGGNLVALRWLGDLARLDDRPAEAIGYYREVLARNPSNEEVRELVETLDRSLSERESAAPTPALEESLPESPVAAAPGNAGEPPEAEVQYGVVDIDALPGDLASFAGLPQSPSTDPVDEAEPDWSDESLFIADTLETGDSLDLADLDRELDAAPLDLQLLEGAPVEDETASFEGGLTLDLPTDEFLTEDLSLTDGATVLEEDGGEPTPHGDPLHDLVPGADAFTHEAAEPGLDEPGSGIDSVLDTAAAEPAPDETIGIAKLETDAFSGDVASADADVADADVAYADIATDDADVAYGDIATADAGAEQTPTSEIDAGFEGGEQAAAPEEPAAALDEPLAAPDEPVAAQDEPADDVLALDDPADAVMPPAEQPEEPTYYAVSDNTDALAEAAAGTPMMPGVDVGGFGNALGGPVTEPGDAGLMTETMAELYGAQGFHDRAAEVYRALLRQRPGDERLMERLAAAEERAVAASPAEVESLVEEDESGEVWLRGVGAPVAEEHADDQATPYAWTNAGEETTAGEPISALLQSILSWRPAAPAAAPAPEEPAGTPEPEPEPEPLLLDELAELPSEAPATPAAEPWMTPPAAPAPAAGAPPAPADEPWLAGAAPSAPAADEPWASAAPAASAASAEPWATPAPSAPVNPPAPVARPTSQNDNPVEAAFDEWYSGGEGEAAGAEPAAAGAGAGSPGSSADEGEQDDEDLEMFRSWLQSLKK